MDIEVLSRRILMVLAAPAGDGETRESKIERLLAENNLVVIGSQLMVEDQRCTAVVSSEGGIIHDIELHFILPSISVEELTQRLAHSHAARCSDDDDQQTIKRLGGLVRDAGYVLMEDIRLIERGSRCVAAVIGPCGDIVEVDANWSALHPRDDGRDSEDVDDGSSSTQHQGTQHPHLVMASESR